MKIIILALLLFFTSNIYAQDHIEVKDQFKKSSMVEKAEKVKKVDKPKCNLKCHLFNFLLKVEKGEKKLGWLMLNMLMEY